jgi:hypothetical protein
MPGDVAMLLLGMLSDAKRQEFTWKVWIRRVQYSLNRAACYINVCQLCLDVQMKHMMEWKVKVNVCVKLQKSPSEMFEMLKTVYGESQGQRSQLSNSKIKTMLICFFHTGVIINFESVPEGTTVNQKLYVEVLKRITDAMRQREKSCGYITH